ncbi:hypothetical protein D3C77_484700 [compost metagenome]
MARQVDQAVGPRPGGVLFARPPPADVHAHDLGATGHGLADVAQADDAQPLAAERRGDAAAGQAPFARPHRAVALGDPAPSGQDQADRMVGHVLMVHAGRMGHRQAPRATPFDVDAVIAGGEAGDQRQVRQALDQILVQLELAGDDQGADVLRRLDGRAFPEAIDVVGAFQEGAQRGQMPLHDQDGGTLGHARTSTRRVSSSRRARMDGQRGLSQASRERVVALPRRSQTTCGPARRAEAQTAKSRSLVTMTRSSRFAASQTAESGAWTPIEFMA